MAPAFEGCSLFTGMPLKHAEGRLPHRVTPMYHYTDSIYLFLTPS